MLSECLACCISAAYKKAASVARYRHHVARHVERPRVRSKNVYIAEPAPELQPMCCEIGAPRRGSAWSWTSTLEIRPDLENDEIADWRRRGHRDADARRGARFYPGRWALPHHRDMAPFIPLWNECRRHFGLAGHNDPLRIGTSAVRRSNITRGLSAHEHPPACARGR